MQVNKKINKTQDIHYFFFFLSLGQTQVLEDTVLVTQGFNEITYGN